MKIDQPQNVWDQEAATFDNEADHGLRDPLIRAAWRDLFVEWLPSALLSILDMGCGTGSLAVLLSSLGHSVTGLDSSAQMLLRAKEKSAAAGYTIPFLQQDAADPQLDEQRFDVIVCRHLLWALPQPERVLRRWASLLKPGGMLILIEGYWQTGAGLHSQQIVAMLPAVVTDVTVHDLSVNPRLWGKAVGDERFAVIATCRVQRTKGEN